jgi:hypothetical protein
MSIFENLQHSNSECCIHQYDFTTLPEAKDRLYSFNYGKIKETKSGLNELLIPTESEANNYKCLNFESETEKGWYYYSIVEHPTFYRLKVYRTYRHKMILASQIGDLEMLVNHFADTDKMKGFALSEAIIHDNWDVVDYLISNYIINKNPIWDAIRYNKVDILKRLLARGVDLPKDWLAYCAYNNSLNATKELIIKQKKHLAYKSDELHTPWLRRELHKDTETAKLIKNTLNKS